VIRKKRSSYHLLLITYHFLSPVTCDDLRLYSEGKADALLQVYEARICAKRIKARVNFEPGQRLFSRVVRLFEPAKRLVALTKRGINNREVVGRDVAVF
jgi:hypothetical protein